MQTCMNKALRQAVPCRRLNGKTSPGQAVPCMRLGDLSTHRRNVAIASSSQTVQAEVAEDVKQGVITELNVDTFYPFLEEAQDTLVLVDFYTDWCGPCKVIYPELVKMSAEYEGRVKFTKVNCNKSNKELGVKLAIKVAPTFHLYRRSEKVAEMTGAKVEKLRSLIEQNV